MKKLIIILIVLFATSVNAAPFLVCDPNSTAIGGGYEVTEGVTTVVEIDAQADGSLRFDLQNVETGTHNWSVKAYVDDEVWGKLYSTPVPFSFTRPSAVLDPIGGLKLVTESQN